MSLETTPGVKPGTYRPSFQEASQASVRPTTEQLERRSRLRRFNRLVLYLPVGLVVLGWLALIAGLVWLSIAGEWFAMDTNQSYYRQLISGVADVFTMLMLLPGLVVCALPIVGAVALLVMRRQRAGERTEEESPLPLFWRIENIVVTIRDTVERTLPRLARPVISAHAAVAFVRRFLISLKRTLSQEILENDDSS